MKLRHNSSVQTVNSRLAASDKVNQRDAKRVALHAESTRKAMERLAQLAEIAKAEAEVKWEETRKRREEKRFETMVEEGAADIEPYLVKNGVTFYAVCPHNMLNIQCTRCALIEYGKKRLSVNVVDICD
jgi:hypothetical protein